MYMSQFILRRGVLLALVAVATACTMKKEEAPGFTGPSEFGTSINITVDPDTIYQDGISASIVTVTARGVNGEPRPNLVVRADIRVGGKVTDFGTLLPRSAQTNAAGKATFVYTAPPTPFGVVIPETNVQIGITPSESDFANASPRFVTLLLLPPVTLLWPKADFVFSPAIPTPGEVVRFNASSSVPLQGRTIIKYEWDFGNGKTGTGVTPTTDFADLGTYTVTLRVTDDGGYTLTTTKPVTVVAPPKLR